MITENLLQPTFEEIGHNEPRLQRICGSDVLGTVITGLECKIEFFF